MAVGILRRHAPRVEDAIAVAYRGLRVARVFNSGRAAPDGSRNASPGTNVESTTRVAVFMARVELGYSSITR